MGGISRSRSDYAFDRGWVWDLAFAIFHQSLGGYLLASVLNEAQWTFVDLVGAMSVSRPSSRKRTTLSFEVERVLRLCLLDC